MIANFCDFYNSNNLSLLASVQWNFQRISGQINGIKNCCCKRIVLIWKEKQTSKQSKKKETTLVHFFLFTLEIVIQFKQTCFSHHLSNVNSFIQCQASFH